MKVHLPNHTNTHISVRELADTIWDYGRDLAGYDLTPEAGEDTVYGDFRLQVYESGDWTYHTGDASYDQDHRGYWGATCVPVNVTRAKAREIARELISEVEEG